MPSLRPHRLITLLLLVLCQLFAQLALARYVCPAQAQVDAAAALQAAGMGCAGLDADQPALCHQQAMGGAQHLDATAAPAMPLAMLIQTVAWPLLPAAGLARPMPPVASAPAWPPPDPVFLATRRLRV